MTFQVAAVAVLVSTVLGAALGLGLARLRGRGRAPAEMLLLLPMVTPEIVMGLSLLLFFLQLFDSNGSFGQLSIAHITFCISYVAITVRARAAGMNPQLEEAARDLGDTALGALRHVTLPLIMPAVIAGALLAFALSFDDYVVTVVQLGHRHDDAAAVHLQRDQVRRLTGDQRDQHDHRRGHRDRAVPRLALRTPGRAAERRPPEAAAGSGRSNPQDPRSRTPRACANGHISLAGAGQERLETRPAREQCSDWHQFLRLATVDPPPKPGFTSPAAPASSRRGTGSPRCGRPRARRPARRSRAPCPGPESSIGSQT